MNTEATDFLGGCFLTSFEAVDVEDDNPPSLIAMPNPPFGLWIGFLEVSSSTGGLWKVVGILNKKRKKDGLKNHIFSKYRYHILGITCRNEIRT